MHTFRAVIFDLDGTLTDNMDLHRQAFEDLLAARQMPPLGVDGFTRYAGKRNEEIFPALLGRPVAGDELEELAGWKEARYRELAQTRLAPLPGLDVLLERLDARTLRYAVATSAPAPNVPATLGGIGLAERFPVVVLGSEVARGKPAPDIFLEAARRLDVDPRACLVFEDAAAGFAAAKAAGMHCVALATTMPAAEIAALGLADDIVPDFAAYLAGPGAWLHGGG